MTLIASSTWTGVFDITRTTGTSPSLRSIRAVGMPAATEMTSRSAGTCGAISSSSTLMSCGLTAMTSVSAALTASVADMASTP
jgi:hypothetical protein